MTRVSRPVVSSPFSKPVVALVGRPNVGKSTLFNRLVGGRSALVEDRPGITRDRHYGEADWAGHGFIVVDTGGFEPEAAKGSIAAQIRAQTELAVEEAALIVFVVDGRAELTVEDREVYARLRRSGRPVLVCANKVDGVAAEAGAYGIYELGADQVMLVSAEHGRGVNDLLDAVVAHLPWPEPVTRASDVENAEAGAEGAEAVPIRVAVVGRPNAGKSSLVNRLLGEERVLVFNEPGTTRDPVDTEFSADGRRFTLIDTAGIRRRGKVGSTIEAYAVVKALAQLDRCDIALTVLDAEIGPTEQDARICGLVHEKGRGQVLVVTKWDLLAQKPDARAKLDEEIGRKLGFMEYVPVVTISSVTGYLVGRIPGLIAEVHAAYNKRIPTGELNRFFERILEHHPPPSDKGRPVRLYFIQQVSAGPPTFMVSANAPERVHLSWKRYLANQLRETFGFVGSPLRLFFRKR